MGHESEKTDADEAARERVQEKAAQELVGRQGHQFLLAASRIILPAECDLAVIEAHQPVIGYGDAVSVARQIMQHVLRPTKRWFELDPPKMSMKRMQKGMEHFFIGERPESTRQAKLACLESTLKTVDKFAAKQAAEHAAREEEAAVTRIDPSRVIKGQTARGDDAMNMRVKEQVLSPGVKHTEKADFRTQVFGIPCDFQESGGTGSKQETVQELLIVEEQWAQCVGQSKDHMHVTNRQEFALARVQPLISSVVETLRAMAVAARVVRDGRNMTTATTTVAVTSECGCPATNDGRQHFAV